ncbi:MAG: TonB-dependent receptor [Desulfobacterales bacterium]|nr:TonB-dependent receptor [Desulfobacterales bacterium]
MVYKIFAALILFFYGSFLSIQAFANETDIDNIQKKIDYLTEIATKTKLNADFVPGIVTVLYGDDLEARGVRTIGEALNLVPGINLVLTPDKLWKTIVRGVPKSFASGHIKVLLDGLPLTTAFGIDAVPNMPIEQIDRIEIIRGPGATIHGEFACSGVVNIIPKKKEKQIFGRFESHETYGGGGIVSYNSKKNDIGISLNFAGMKSHADRIDSVNPQFGLLYPDSEQESAAIESYFTGNNHESKNEYISSLFSANYMNMELNAHAFENKQEEFAKTKTWGVSIKNKSDISGYLKLKINAGIENQKFDSEYSSYFDINYTPTNDWIYTFNYDERTIFGDIGLIFKKIENHTILTDISIVRMDLDDVSKNDGSVYYKGKTRDIISISLDDEFKITDKFFLNSGIRYDNYSDINDRYSPRISAVYLLNNDVQNRHILKLQYAKAFRPPTFIEIKLAKDPNIIDTSFGAFETIQTYEFGYIYRSFSKVFRSTCFYSDINAKETFMDKELKNFSSKGIEFELNWPFMDKIFNIDTNLSIFTTQGTKDSGKIEYLSNVGLSFQPIDIFSICFQYRYSDTRNIFLDDPTANKDDSHILDVTLNLFNLGIKGLNLKAGVKNIFEQNSGYEIQSEGDSNAKLLIIPNDTIKPSRWWWIKLSYEF